MKIVSIRKAKADFFRLLEDVAGGEEFVITKAGKPVGRLLPPLEKKAGKRQLGLLAGKLKIPADFDAELPADVLDAFEGGGDDTGGKPR